MRSWCAATLHCNPSHAHRLRDSTAFGSGAADGDLGVGARQALLENFPSPDTSLSILREGAVESSERRWDENWARTCQPVFTL
jgi:hypothetical protein